VAFAQPLPVGVIGFQCETELLPAQLTAESPAKLQTRRPAESDLLMLLATIAGF
jgi:hypothetical protein